MSQPISTFRGDSFYLDTMIFYTVLRASNAAAHSLLKQVEQGVYQSYTAALSFDELAYRMLLALIRNKYGKSPQDRLRQDQAGVIAEFTHRSTGCSTNSCCCPISLCLISPLWI